MKGRLMVPDHLLANVLSFCDASDHITVLRASQQCFSTALGLFLANASSLSLSFLLRLYPNALQENGRHETALQILMSLLVSSSKNKEEKDLKHLELANLRGATGRGWFSHLLDFPIVTLDLSNNVQFDENLLYNFLAQGPRNLQHLHLTGCNRITPEILRPLQTERHSQLISLSIGGCSQSIGTEFLFSLLRNLRELQHLNLQGLNGLEDATPSDPLATFVDMLPNTLKSLNLTGCKNIRLICQDAAINFAQFAARQLEFQRIRHTQMEGRLPHVGVSSGADEYCWNGIPLFRLQLESLILDGIGTTRRLGRRGIEGTVLAMLALGRSLRQVHLSGSEQVHDYGIQALAYNCRHTLTCFQIRGGSIGKRAIVGLARYCEVLRELDLSACMELGDDDISVLCQPRHIISKDGGESNCAKRRLVNVRSRLKVLRLAGLPKITNASLESISSLDSLLILDVHDCPFLTTTAVHKTVKVLPLLVEINAKDIARSSRTLTSLLRKEPGSKYLRIVNERVFATDNHDSKGCCSIRRQSQRLSATVSLQSMYHCITCHLIPSVDLGVCAECIQKCHQGHETFLGSYSRFYCDCPFVTNASGDCQALLPGCTEETKFGAELVTNSTADEVATVEDMKLSAV
ncbi:leucine rich repeat LRR-containing protein [Nitzschia inconspicua]|uniref:Leucine rich repeat LRR-containing protein n=1 Tax=Nitzschia inconspicua TaxID=303405 RepID=A0A9K3Q2Y0_9STRA|nr:leucine rich repeat LRR-containing protein [Nitzschia inconspicua]